jgi:hypothetical protein
LKRDIFLMSVVRELESLQHIIPGKHGANKDEHADSFNSASLDDGIGQELSQGMSVDRQFGTRRDKEDMAQPITPVLKCEEKRIEQRINLFRLSRQAQEKNRDHHGRIDYCATKEEWNSLCWKELLKPITQRANVMGPHGFMHMHIVSLAVIDTRQVIHQQNQQVSMVGTATATTAFSHQISDQTGKGNGDEIIAPLADIIGPSTPPINMQLVQQHQQLQPSSKK